jgi:hypothetical protein
MDLWFKVLSLRQKMDSEYLNGWKHLDEKKVNMKTNWLGWAWKVQAKDMQACQESRNF